jgi:hypothetical protein
MLTFFTTAKPFKGHDGIIQRNALKSWTLLHPGVRVIVFGDDEGAAEVCAELGLQHEPKVERHESGAKRLNHMFRRAQELSAHDFLCFSNCDIILMSDFWDSFEKARAWRKRFLLVARRWDTDVTEPIDFSSPVWAPRLRAFAMDTAFQQDAYWIDIFLFSRGMYLDMPPLIVGHCFWDNWMIWKAKADHAPVLDSTHTIMPIHQNHGYNPVFGRVKGYSKDALSLFNLSLIGGMRHFRNINSSTHYVGRNGKIRFRWFRHPGETPKSVLAVSRFVLYKVWLPVWHALLGITRPLRSVLGLRSGVIHSRRKA